MILGAPTCIHTIISDSTDFYNIVLPVIALTMIGFASFRVARHQNV